MAANPMTIDDYMAIAPLFGFFDPDSIRDFAIDQQRKADNRSAAQVRKVERSLRV